MSDENEPVYVEHVVKAVSARIGDGEGTIFVVEHPAAPNVITALYRAVGGEEVTNPPLRDNKRVVYSFVRPPVENEFIAVVIG